MSNRKLFMLAVTAGIMIAASIWQAHLSGRVKPKEPKQAVYLIQGLDPADIGIITIGKEPGAVRLVRQQNRFVVADKDNYPASTTEINNLIAACLDIKTTELYTRDPSNHADLEVTEEKARYLVRFLKSEPGQNLLSGIIIGKVKEPGQGTFVRLVNNNDVYLTEESPWIKTNALDYIKQDIVSVEKKDIISVEVISSEEKYTLKKQAEDTDTVILENLPPGKKLKSPEARQVFEALTNLRFDDVLSAGKSNMDFDRQFICRLKDSTVYTLKIAHRDDKSFIACTAEFTDTTPVTKQPGQVDSEAELKEKEAKLLARDKAEEFTDKHKGWIYQIPDYKAQNLTKKLADLLEEEPKEEPKEKPKEEPKEGPQKETPASQ